MNRPLLTFMCMLFFTLTLQSQTPDIFINEFLASNDTGLTDEAGEFEDWVELYNAGSTAVDIGGMFVTDDLAEPTLWQIPTTDPAATTIPAGGFLILFFDKDTDQGILHVDAKLSGDGESIGLFESDGITAIDTYTYGLQVTDASFGRTEDGGSEWDYFLSPTPDATNNDASTGLDQTEIPVADVEGGFYAGSVTIALTSATDDAEIYYTLDGSEPDDGDELYEGPLTFTNSEVIRAVAYAPPLEPSRVMTHSYLIDIDHDFVVVTMTTDPDNLFDADDGLFIQYEEELEKPAHIQFFEPDGTLAFSQDIEIELQGNASLGLPQKSLKMKAKASLGNEFFEHEMFPIQDFDKYRSFLMRQSGQDWNRTMFRDALQQTLMQDVTDLNGIIKQPDLDLQSYRPAILYINGEYWGIQNVREQMNWKYLDTHYGIGKDEVDIVENTNELERGDLVEWESLTEFFEDNDFSNQANYDSLSKRVDLDHFMDYMLHGIIVDNNDWPGNNNKHYRERTDGARWRWMTKDLDFGFGLRPLNGDWDSGDFTTNMLEACLAEDSDEYYNRPDATLFLRRVMENAGARTQFINRTADLLNTIFDEDRVMGRIDSLENLYIPEMQMHYDKWQSGWNGHAAKVEVLRTFADGRFPEVRNHFENYFSEITGQSSVTINANPEQGGVVHFNTLSIHEAFFPWTGTYFRGMEVPAEAVANRGYFFTDWSGAASGTNETVSVDINASSETLTANFQLGSTATDPIVINEINYNSSDDLDSEDWVELYNPNAAAVDISGWYFEDESGNYFGFPQNTIMPADAYFLLVADEAAFNVIYPNLPNVFGAFGDDPNGFGLSGKGELVTLKNAAGVLIDAVEYDDNDPWPDSPDGDGPTLQLIVPSFDNALPESWGGIPATPGSLNIGFLVFNCPDDISVTTAPNSEGEIVSWTTETPIATCPTGTVSVTQTGGLPSGTVFPVGITTVSYELSDECGNLVNCSFDVTVTIDFGILTLDCTNDITVEAEPGAPDALATWPTPTFSTTCPISSVVTFTQTGGPANGSVLPIGTSTVTYEATDDCGNAMACTFTVTVADGTITLECPEDLNVLLPQGANSTLVSWDVPTITTICGGGGGNPNPNCGIPLDGFTSIGTFNDHQYYISTTKKVWTDAKTTCESFGGHLAVITTLEENEYIGQQTDVKLHIGLADENTEGELEWVNGEPVGYVNFSSGNINDDGNDYAYFQPWNDKWELSGDGAYRYFLMELDCDGGGGIQLTQTGGPFNNSDLSVGTYNITYEGTDDCGDLQFCSFEVTVDPNPVGLVIDCPNNYTVSAAIGTGGAIVNLPVATANNANCVGPISVVQTGGLPTGSFFAFGNYTITYEATDACNNVMDCSYNLNVILDGSSTDYCVSEGTTPWKEHINNVTLGSINNTSAKDGYGDFTNLSTTLVSGESYAISILPKFSYTQYDEYIRVWIDYNNDFDFTDNDELVFSFVRPAGQSGTIADPVLGAIDVPFDVTDGNTRMRVSMKRGAFATPCEIFEFGEVEDYTINLTGGTPGQLITNPNGLINNNRDGYAPVVADERDESSIVTAIRKTVRTFPNPVKDLLWLDLQTFNDQQTTLFIYNALGQMVIYQTLESETLASPHSVEVGDLNRGVYWISVVGEDGSTAVVKMLKE